MISRSTLLVLLPLVFASPLERRNTTCCGQFDTVTSDPYSLLANQWGKSDAESGWQCSTLTSVLGDTAAWSTQWDWVGGNTIKSFSNIQLNKGINQQLSAITSISSIWHWSQQSFGPIVADVAFDLFTSDTAGGSNLNEVMVWLASFNAGPISYEYSSDGQAVAIAYDLHITGYTWNLYMGNNGHNTVYSFLPVSGDVYSFRGDIYHFFTYLVHHGHIGSSEYLVTAQAGTEVTSGAATFDTSAYSLSIS